MNNEKKPVRFPIEVASALTTFIVTEFGEDADSPVVMEGIFLAMQMVGGPRQAAEVIGYCSVRSV